MSAMDESDSHLRLFCVHWCGAKSKGTIDQKKVTVNCPQLGLKQHQADMYFGLLISPTRELIKMFIDTCPYEHRPKLSQAPIKQIDLDERLELSSTHFWVPFPYISTE